MIGKNLLDFIIMLFLVKKWRTLLGRTTLLGSLSSIDAKIVRKLYTDIYKTRGLELSDMNESVIHELEKKIQSNALLASMTNSFYIVYLNIIAGLSIFDKNYVKELKSQFNLTRSATNILSKHLPQEEIIHTEKSQIDAIISNAINNNHLTDIAFIVKNNTLTESQYVSICSYLECGKDEILSKITEDTRSNIYQNTTIKELREISKSFGLGTGATKEAMIKIVEPEIFRLSSEIEKMDKNTLNNFLSLITLSNEAVEKIALKVKIPTDQNKLQLLINLSKSVVNKTISKTTISKKIKEEVWKKYMGNVYEAKCYCCEQYVITSTSFSAGHVVSEKDGGKVSLENLRPVCMNCNSKMGTEHMFSYAKRIYKKNLI